MKTLDEFNLFRLDFFEHAYMWHYVDFCYKAKQVEVIKTEEVKKKNVPPENRDLAVAVYTVEELKPELDTTETAKKGLTSLLYQYLDKGEDIDWVNQFAKSGTAEFSYFPGTRSNCWQHNPMLAQPGRSASNH